MNKDKAEGNSGSMLRGSDVSEGASSCAPLIFTSFLLRCIFQLLTCPPDMNTND